MLLFTLLLSIFSGALFLIDVVLLALAGWLFYQAKKHTQPARLPIYQSSKFIMGCFAIVAWIVTIIMRASDI